MSAGRSNSSFKTRENLKKNFASVPEIAASISVERYLQLSDALFAQGVKYYKKNDLIRCYIDFQKFVVLMTKLPKHAAVRNFEFNSSSKEYRWTQEKLNHVLVYLEDVVTRLDKEEDMRIQAKIDHDLMEEFDQIDSKPEAPTATPPLASSSSGSFVTDNTNSVIGEAHRLNRLSILKIDNLAIGSSDQNDIPVTLPSNFKYDLPDFYFPDIPDAQDMSRENMIKILNEVKEFRRLVHIRI